MTLDLGERNSVQDEGENPPPNPDTCESEPKHNRIFVQSFPSTSTASGAEKLFLVFVGLCSFVFAQPTALQPRDPSFVSKKEDRRC